MFDLKSKCTSVDDMKEENDDKNISKEIQDLVQLFKNKFHVHVCNTLIELKVKENLCYNFIKISVDISYTINSTSNFLFRYYFSFRLSSPQLIILYTSKWSLCHCFILNIVNF